MSTPHDPSQGLPQGPEDDAFDPEGVSAESGSTQEPPPQDPSPQDPSPQDPSPQNLADARWTAYALGECTPEEAEACAAELAQNPELAREVEEIRIFGGMLEQELAAGTEAREAGPLLDDTQRATIVAAAAAAQGQASATQHESRVFSMTPWLRAAALFFLVIAVGWVVLENVDSPDASQEQALARADAEDMLQRDTLASEGSDGHLANGNAASETTPPEDSKIGPVAEQPGAEEPVAEEPGIESEAATIFDRAAQKSTTGVSTDPADVPQDRPSELQRSAGVQNESRTKDSRLRSGEENAKKVSPAAKAPARPAAKPRMSVTAGVTTITPSTPGPSTPGPDGASPGVAPGVVFHMEPSRVATGLVAGGGGGGGGGQVTTNSDEFFMGAGRPKSKDSQGRDSRSVGFISSSEGQSLDAMTDSLKNNASQGVRPNSPRLAFPELKFDDFRQPGAGAFFNDGKDGTIRGLTEHFFENKVKDSSGANPSQQLDDGSDGDLFARTENLFVSTLTDTYGYARADAIRLKNRLARYVDALRAPGDSSANSSANLQLDFQLAHRRVANEEYSRIHERPFDTSLNTPLSTFSIDVDTASYANTRRMLEAGQLPPADAIRIEEWLNYFRYDYPAPTGDDPFSIDIEIADCPWQKGHRLARIGLRGREFETTKPTARNLVFLIDVSGSMQSNNKLPLLKQGLRMLVQNLTDLDRVSIVTYAGASGCALPPTSAKDSPKILAAIDNLEAGGSTNGAAGIELAYQLAVQNYDAEGVNRVILATDGDFNVGVSADGPLTRIIEEKRKSGVFLSVLGFGTGNLKDSKMEALADHGNGNYAYIDSVREAKKVLVNDLSATLVTIAKDVKIQVEFNPSKVAAYRLIGYENRALAAQDFNDDRKDAGEIGAGHRVTALYQIVPVGQSIDGANIDALKYQKTPQPQTDAPLPGSDSDESLTVKLRYKEPNGAISKRIERGVVDKGLAFGAASGEFRFATAVAQFGLVLRGSQFAGTSTLEFAHGTAAAALGQDAFGYREELLKLMERAQQFVPDVR